MDAGTIISGNSAYFCSDKQIFEMIEYYASEIYPFIASGLSHVSGLFAFSLSGLTIAAAALWVLWRLADAIRKKRGFRVILFRLVGPLLLMAGWIYASWGILYFRDDWFQRSGTEKAAPDSAAYVAFLEGYIDNLNRSYAESSPFRPLAWTISLPISLPDSIRGSIRGSRPDSLPNNSGQPAIPQWWDSAQAQRADSLIEQSYSRLGDYRGIAYPGGKRRPKKVFMGWYYTKTSILGYFVPLFHEIHLNPRMPWVQYPASLAHEKAHQFGITSEAECNFYGYLACVTSDDPFVRYSGYFSVLGYVAADARRLLPESYIGYLQRIEPAIRRESGGVSAYWRANEHQKLSRIQTKVYDTYLKTNGIRTGIKNYSEVTALLLSYYQCDN